MAQPPQLASRKHLFDDVQSHQKLPVRNKIGDSWFSPTAPQVQFRPTPSLFGSSATWIHRLPGWLSALGLGLTPSPHLAWPLSPQHPSSITPSQVLPVPPDSPQGLPPKSLLWWLMTVHGRKLRSVLGILTAHCVCLGKVNT